jgi:CRP/FNR family cyclic AMP-dependent transcriptional regulator
VRDVELYALAGMAEDLAANLGRFNLFADLGRPQLDAIADADWERWYSDGERVLRRGMSGSGFYVVLDGEAIVQLDGEERSRLRAGDFFGEVSTLLGTGPTADIVAAGPLRCLEIPGPQLEAFLLDYPRVMFRMLQTEAWRLQEALEWRT